MQKRRRAVPSFNELLLAPWKTARLRLVRGTALKSLRLHEAWDLPRDARARDPWAVATGNPKHAHLKVVRPAGFKQGRLLVWRQRPADALALAFKIHFAVSNHRLFPPAHPIISPD